MAEAAEGASGAAVVGEGEAGRLKRMNACVYVCVCVCVRARVCVLKLGGRESESLEEEEKEKEKRGQQDERAKKKNFFFLLHLFSLSLSLSRLSLAHMPACPPTRVPPFSCQRTSTSFLPSPVPTHAAISDPADAPARGVTPGTRAPASFRP